MIVFRIVSIKRKDKMEKRSRDLAKNTGILAIGTFLPKLASFITLPILTACLTKAEYGTYDLISTLVSLILPIATIKLEAGMFRFLIDSRNNREECKRIITTALFFMLPIAFFTVLIMFFVLQLNPITKLLICIYFFIDSIFRFLQQIVRGLGRNTVFSISAIAYSVLNMCFIVLFVKWQGYGLNGVLLSMNISLIVASIILFISVHLFSFLSFSCFSKSTLLKMIKYSWPMLPNSLSSWVMRLSDRLVITAVLGIEANAVYAVANKIPQLMSIAQSTFTFAWQENASLSVKDQDVEKYYSQMFRSVFDLMTGVFTGLIAVMPILFMVLVKGDYVEAYQQMPILLGGMFFCALSAFLGGIYVAHMKTTSVGISTFIAAVINFIVDIALIHSIGLYAASGSTLISYFILCIYRMIDVQKFQKVNYEWKHIIKCIIVIILMSIVSLQNSVLLQVINFIVGISYAVYLNKKILIGLVKTVLRK